MEIKFTDKEALYMYRSTAMRGTQDSAAIDLRADDDYNIPPGDVVMIGTKLAINIDNPNIAGFILPRSGLGSKGLVLGNLTGLIDSDYQGEIKISAWNRIGNRRGGIYFVEKDPDIFYIKKGDRIAQLTFVNICQPDFEIVEEFSTTTDRGDGGFGSTGV